MILNIYLKGGHALRVDHITEWKLGGGGVQWTQDTKAKVRLSHVDPDEIVAVTREDVRDDG